MLILCLVTMVTGDSCAVGGASGGRTGTRAIFLSTYGTSGCPSEVEHLMKASKSAARDEVLHAFDVFD